MLLSGRDSERLRLLLTRLGFHTTESGYCGMTTFLPDSRAAPYKSAKEELMENSGKTFDVSSDVLHFENHSKLSAEEIAKAVQRHNREHKDDARKAARLTRGTGKKR
jgi:hypothetical protein